MINVRLFLKTNTLVFLLSFFSCKEDEQILNPPTDASFSKGVFITNEGAFNNGNASLTFYNTETGEVQEKIFEMANAKPLGDVLQSMKVVDGKAFLVLNNSNKVEVVNLTDFKSIATINHLVAPRYFQNIDNTIAYLSDIYAGSIAIIDLNTYQQISSINFPGWSEEMIRFGPEVYVTNPTFFNQKITNQLFVINTQVHQITDSIEVGFNPISFEIDKENRLWVLCNGVESVKKTWRTL